MRVRDALPALLGVFVLALVGGCTDSTGGVAAPGGSGDGSSEPPSSSSDGPGSSDSAEPTVAIPPRPKDLPLDGVQPCSLFTKAQLNQLGITDPPTSDTTSGHYEAPTCLLEIATLDTFESYEVVTITTEGIESWLSGKRNVEGRLSEVAGFPAATYWFRGAEGTKTIDCATSVDVAEGQQLMVTADNDADHSYTLDQLCQRAERAAGMALQTLQTLR